MATQYPLPSLTLSEPQIPALALGTCSALSVRQPWATAIIFGGKDIENRTWPTRYRGRVLIHAGKGMDTDDVEGFRDLIEERSIRTELASGLKLSDLMRGGIIGEVEIVDCVSKSDSPWFVGPWGFVLRNPKRLPFTPCRGMLGFFLPQNK
jgi:hypothetical protein